MEVCVFCSILGYEAPGFIVCEDEEWAALIPLRPAVYGHLLVVPRLHVETLEELHPGVLTALVLGLRHLASTLPQFNVVLNNGSEAGQTIPHLHFHLLPRKTGDELGDLPLSANVTSARYYAAARAEMADNWMSILSKERLGA
jgi:histidine triad (HIT) family protein